MLIKAKARLRQVIDQEEEKGRLLIMLIKAKARSSQAVDQADD